MLAGDAAVPEAEPVCIEGGLELVAHLTTDDFGTGRPEEVEPIVGSCGPGLAVVDLDGDGALDVIAAGYWGETRALLGDGLGGLTASDTVTFDGGALPSGNGLAAADIDGDGDSDLVYARSIADADLVYVNDGTGVFTSTELPDSTGESQTPSFGDLDGDGDLDLFMARHADVFDTDFVAVTQGTATADPNALYLNDGGTFTDASDRIPIDCLDDFTFHGAWLDAEQDGDLDLYLANDFGPWLEPARLLVSDGAGALEVAEDCHCELDGFEMGASIGDVNDDGLPDLYVTNVGAPTLLSNLGECDFADATAALGAAAPPDDVHMSSWASRFVDVDLDGHEEIATVYGPVLLGFGVDWLDLVEDETLDTYNDGDGQRDVLMRATDAGFSDVSTAWGFDHDGTGRGLVTADLDRDGRPELLTTGYTDVSTQYLRVYRSVDGCGPGVTLDFGALDAHDVGARIDVTTAERSYTRWMLPSSTFSSSSAQVVLGLGEADSANVTISWMGGGKSVLTELGKGEVVAVAP